MHQVNIQWGQVKLHCSLTKFRLLWNSYFHPCMGAVWMGEHKECPPPCACKVHCHAWALLCNTMVCTNYPCCNSQFLRPCPSKYLEEGGRVWEWLNPAYKGCVELTLASEGLGSLSELQPTHRLLNLRCCHDWGYRMLKRWKMVKGNNSLEHYLICTVQILWTICDPLHENPAYSTFYDNTHWSYNPN